MQALTRAGAKQYMRIEVEHVPNCTQLVENCAHAFDCDDILDDPDHFVWEVGLEVWEERHGDY